MSKNKLNVLTPEKIEKYKQDLIAKLNAAISDTRTTAEEQIELQNFLIRIRNDTEYLYEDIYELCSWLIQIFQKLK